MSILNFGSLNLDHVYSMDHFVRPGETFASDGYHVYCGGKGLNQSIAAGKAGSTVFHAGMYGPGGELLLEALQSNRVDVSFMKKTPVAQGHAIIQVTPEGENAILLYPGSNHQLTQEYISVVLSKMHESCYVILQNETSEVPYIIERAFSLGHKVVFNAAPFDVSLRSLPLSQISWLIINEIEGEQLTGESEPSKILARLRELSPSTGVVLTLGKDGALCSKDGVVCRQESFPVCAVDTTAAGDTFTGFFVSALDQGRSIPEALRFAAAAAAIAVTRNGASPSIPTQDEVQAFLNA